MNDIRRADSADIPKLTQVLVRAFDGDPFINWFVVQDARRTARLQATFQLILQRMSGRLNETFTTASLEGCAVWKRPGEHALGGLELLGLLPGFARAMGWTGIPRFSRLLEHAQGLHERLAPEPHYYLFVLGVDPPRQGRGHGARLLEPVLARCDSERRAAYLETARAENLPFYERQGFRVAHVIDESRFPKLWLMLRPAP